MTFQDRVERWMTACFGEQLARDPIERNHRLLEEVFELVQACGCTKSEVIQMADYVFNQDKGQVYQEVGDVMNTIAALCTAHGIDMIESGHVKLDHCWTMIEKTRAKHATKPKLSPLPQSAEDDMTDEKSPLQLASSWNPMRPKIIFIGGHSSAGNVISAAVMEATGAGVDSTSRTET